MKRLSNQAISDTYNAISNNQLESRKGSKQTLRPSVSVPDEGETSEGKRRKVNILSLVADSNREGQAAEKSFTILSDHTTSVKRKCNALPYLAKYPSAYAKKAK